MKRWITPILALIVVAGIATLVALVIIQPWEASESKSLQPWQKKGTTAAATRLAAPTANPAQLTEGEVCAIVMNDCYLCRTECSAWYRNRVGQGPGWSVTCSSGASFSFRESTGIVASENQLAARCTQTRPTPRSYQRYQPYQPQ